MTHGERSLAGAIFLLLAVLVPTASSAPIAAPSGSLTQISGRGGCVSGTDTPRFRCTHLRGFDGFLASVSISPDGSYVYTSGLEAIHVFRRDPTTGVLTQLPGVRGCLVVVDAWIAGDPANGCSPLRGSRFLAGSLVLGPEGRTAYVPVVTRSRGAVSPTVMSFSRDPRTGALRQSPEPPLCVKIRSNPECPRLTYRYGFNAIVSRDGRNLYLTSEGASWVFKRDPVTGRLEQVAEPGACLQTTGYKRFGCAEARAGVIDAESPDGGYAYAIRDLNTPASKRSTENSIAALRRDPHDGTLTPLPGKAGCVSSAPRPRPCASARVLLGIRRVLVSADGRHLYAIATRFESSPNRPDNSAVTVFELSSATGALTQVPGTAGCVSYSGRLGCVKSRALFALADVTLSPDDRHLYVSSWADGLLVVFRRDPVTGALTQLPGKAGCIGRPGTRTGLTCTRVRALENPGAVAVSPDGRHVYALSTAEIIGFRRAG